MPRLPCSFEHALKQQIFPDMFLCQCRIMRLNIFFGSQTFLLLIARLFIENRFEAYIASALLRSSLSKLITTKLGHPIINYISFFTGSPSSRTTWAVRPPIHEDQLFLHSNRNRYLFIPAFWTITLNTRSKDQLEP